MWKFISIGVVVPIVLCALLSGCTEDEAYYKLTGRWEGKNTNQDTGRQWSFNLLIEHRGDDISGVYTDFRGSRTIRAVSYDGESFSFLIDLWPETVTYFGVVDSESSMNGTWSYSGDDNNGQWYLLKNRDPDSEEDDDDDENDSE